MLESGLQPRTCDCQVQCLSNQEALQQPRHDAFKPSYLIYQGQGRWWPQRCEAWRGILKQISWRQNMLKRSRSVTLCDPMDRSLSGSSVHGISQARVLQWIAISFSNAWKWKGNRSVVCDSLRPHGLQPTFSNTTVQKHIFFGAQPSSQSNSHIHTWPLEKP